MSLLELDGLEVHYGDFQAIHGVSLALEQGEVLALIGANGAGKSTLMKAVAGVMRPSAGAIRLSGTDITRVPAHQRVAAGVALTPEGRRIFKSLSVEENLLVGAHTKRKGPWNLQKVYDTFPLVSDRRKRIGGNLSGGEQQAAAIGRALMSNPDVLLVDEVSLGLAPVVVQEIYAAIPTIVAEGTSVLLVEQDVNQAMRVADRLMCLLEGRVVLEGTPATLSREEITSAYFGIKEAS